MKNAYIIIISLAILLLGYIYLKQTYHPEPFFKSEEIKDKKIKESRIDTIFLDYRFGMSESEFKNHTKKLIIENKLDNNGKYDFKFDIPSTTSLVPEFHNDKLYSLQLILHHKDNSGFSSPELLFYPTVSFFLKKYHLVDVFEGNSYEYTKSNLKITILNNIYAPYVEYLDNTTDSIIKTEKETQKEQLIKDI